MVSVIQLIYFLIQLLLSRWWAERRGCHQAPGRDDINGKIKNISQIIVEKLEEKILTLTL